MIPPYQCLSTSSCIVTEAPARMECCPDQVRQHEMMEVADKAQARRGEGHGLPPSRHAHGTGEFAGIILNTSALLLVSLLKAAG
jgi:hypothetical protein